MLSHTSRFGAPSGHSQSLIVAIRSRTVTIPSFPRVDLVWRGFTTFHDPRPPWIVAEQALSVELDNFCLLPSLASMQVANIEGKKSGNEKDGLARQ
jgi:hypothetical protein